jgi:hypothetical protein
MPDAVTSRKRQVSRLRDCGFKRAFSKSLYKAPAVPSESGSLERNFRINPVEVSLAGNSRVVFSAMMRFSIDGAFVRWNSASSFQAWEIRVSEITRASRSIAFHCSDRDHASHQLGEKRPPFTKS